MWIIVYMCVYVSMLRRECCVCREAAKLLAVGRTLCVRRDGVYACMHPCDDVYVDTASRAHPKH